LLGAVSDKVGRKPLLMLAFLGQVVDFSVAAYADSDPEFGYASVFGNAHIWMFAARVFSGVCGSPGLFTRAYVGDVSTELTGASNFSKLIAMIGLSFVVGPAVGAVTAARSGRRTVMMIGTVCNILGMFWTCAFLPESLREEYKKKDLDWSKANPFGMLQFLFSSKFLAFFGLASLLDQLTLTITNTVFFQYLDKVLNVERSQAGGMLGTFGIFQVITYYCIMRPLVRSRGEVFTMQVGYSVSFGSLLLFGIVGQAFQGLQDGETMPDRGLSVYLVMMLLGAGSMSNPAEYALSARCVGKDEQGKLQAATGSFDVLGKMIGSAAVALIFESSTKAGFAGAIWWFAAAALTPAVFFTVFCIRSALPERVREAHVSSLGQFEAFSAYGSKVSFASRTDLDEKAELATFG